MDDYFVQMEKKVVSAYDVSKKARKQGFDPEKEPPIPLAEDMAERSVGLISAVAPGIANKGIDKRIKELEKKFGAQDWRVALTIAEEIAAQKFCKFSNKLEAMEVGMRVGFAYITMGTVASPLEGFVRFAVKKRKDGKEYLSLYYSGPIRSAGGTGASVSVLIADHLRKKAGLGEYDASDQEIKRIITEVHDYHERVTNLQYMPSDEELAYLVKNTPLQIDGDPSEDMEVSNYKDLDRIETNRVRNGICLVYCECLAQKAPKIWKQISKWGAHFGLEHWSFLKEFLQIQSTFKSKIKETAKKEKVAPNYTYIKDLVAGRPVLSHPLRSGGFRLRYGRSRTSGYSAAAIHPATSIILDSYIATGTQIKVERPGKAATITFCDTIECPIVKLNNGSVVRLQTVSEAKKVKNEIQEIIFLGDILFNYGDFYNRAHLLAPPGYCEEYWVQEFEKETVNLFGNIDLEKLGNLASVEPATLQNLLRDPLSISADVALSLSQNIGIPLHPRYTLYWDTISREQFLLLISWLSKAKIFEENNKIKKIVLPFEENPKRVIELLALPHHVVNKEFVVIKSNDAHAFYGCFQLPQKNISDIRKSIEAAESDNGLDLINKVSGIKIKNKSGIFIGSRMGRPEKAKMRKLTGSPHVLFPVGKEGGKLRCFQSAMEAGKIVSEFSAFKCTECNNETVFSVCEKCGHPAKKVFWCNVCGLIETESCPKHGKASTFVKREIDINNYFSLSLKKLKLHSYPDLIKGVRGTSNRDHLPENLMKGVLRAKNDIYVNKDGTVRYDMTQLPITHFKPKEIGTRIDLLIQLGYEKDIKGEELLHEDQILELKPQDVILPSCEESPDEGADSVLSRVCSYVDELLSRMYGIKPYYNLTSKGDLPGQLVVVLAPHTSAGIVARIIGFSKTQGFFAHPMLHAATRRDCDGDEASVMMLMDALLNFSRYFLPKSRGSTQDAPLVLTSKLIPSEVDDMVFDLDVAWKYPLEFYKAAEQYKAPWDVKIEQLSDRLGSEKQYYDFGFTHNTSDINDGIRCSAYKTMPSMEEKLLGQMKLAEKIRAADEVDVARLVIEKHFLPDIKGNLRKFSMQQFRCVDCNEKYRRPPLIGKCVKCGGKIIFTISEGSIIKYLEPSISLAKKYHLPSYLKQTLELTKRRVEDVFGKDKEKQVVLGQWFG